MIWWINEEQGSNKFRHPIKVEFVVLGFFFCGGMNLSCNLGSASEWLQCSSSSNCHFEGSSWYSNCIADSACKPRWLYTGRLVSYWISDCAGVPNEVHTPERCVLWERRWFAVLFPPLTSAGGEAGRLPIELACAGLCYTASAHWIQLCSRGEN